MQRCFLQRVDPNAITQSGRGVQVTPPIREWTGADQIETGRVVKCGLAARQPRPFLVRSCVNNGLDRDNDWCVVTNTVINLNRLAASLAGLITVRNRLGWR